MSTDDRTPFVARPEDLDALRTHATAAAEGGARLVRLVAPFGGGRRAVTGELLRGLQSSSDDAILWRVACSDQENGVQWIMRMYGSLVGFIANDVLLRGKVEMVLNSRLPKEPKRVQDWYQAFVQTLREAKPDRETGQIQLRVAQDNPLLGLVEVVRGISRKIPIVLELQNAHQVQTVLLAQFLEALLDDSADAKLLVIVHDEPDGDVRSATHPQALLDLFSRRADDVHLVELAPWGEAEVKAFLDGRGLTSDAARIAAITDGRPGFVSDLVDILTERETLDADLSDVTLASLTPLTVDEDELDAPEGEPEEGKPKPATADDASRVAFLAALLGQAFPSGLVAEMGGFDKESVDDLIDAMDGLFAEVQYQEDMQSWIYRFIKGSYREGVVQLHDTDEGHELARRVGVFMERFLAPRGLGFMNRTSRIYAEHGATQRAASMRSLALTNDDPNAWGVAYEMLRYFDETPWPDTLRRTIFMTLLDHMASSGQLQTAEKVNGEVNTWAQEQDDRDLQAWLLLNGSKLDLRRQDLYRARDRARDALALFEALETPNRIAECHIQLASVALADGKADEAATAADAALQAATTDKDGQKVVPPGVAAQAELIRGVAKRRKNELDDAIGHFRKANEVAGTAGLGPLAVDAGINLGEALLASRKVPEGRDVLQRVVQACRQLGVAPRERAAAELLAQAEGAGRNWAAALGASQRALQISQQLKLTQNLPQDLYHVGFFHLAQNKGAEALPFFQQADKLLEGQGNHPIQRDLQYHLGLSLLQAQQLEPAKVALDKSVPLLRAANDHRKLVTALDQMAGIAHRSGDVAGAKELVQQALTAADQGNMKDEARALRKRLEQL